MELLEALQRADVVLRTPCKKLLGRDQIGGSGTWIADAGREELEVPAHRARPGFTHHQRHAVC